MISRIKIARLVGLVTGMKSNCWSCVHDDLGFCNKLTSEHRDSPMQADVVKWLEGNNAFGAADTVAPWAKGCPGWTPARTITLARIGNRLLRVVDAMSGHTY